METNSFAETTEFTGMEDMFVVSQVKTTILDARARCAAWGGELSTPRNEQENTFLADQYGIILLAANDIENEGEFVYFDGTPVEYTNWNVREPNNLNDDEDCVIMKP